MDMIEVKIKVSDEDKTLTKKHLHYDQVNEPDTYITMSHDNPILQRMVTESVSEFKGEPTDIVVTTRMVW